MNRKNTSGLTPASFGRMLALHGRSSTAMITPLTFEYIPEEHEDRDAYACHRKSKDHDVNGVVRDAEGDEKDKKTKPEAVDKKDTKAKPEAVDEKDTKAKPEAVDKKDTKAKSEAVDDTHGENESVIQECAPKVEESTKKVLELKAVDAPQPKVSNAGAQTENQEETQVDAAGSYSFYGRDFKVKGRQAWEYAMRDLGSVDTLLNRYGYVDPKHRRYRNNKHLNL